MKYFITSKTACYSSVKEISQSTVAVFVLKYTLHSPCIQVR